MAGVCLALAGSCLYAAATLDSPRLVSATPVLKPPPGNEGPGFKLGQRFEALLREKYPELLDAPLAGTPIVLAVVNEDWSIERSAKIMTAERIEDIKPGEEVFGVLGMAREDVPYVGAMNLQKRADVKEFVLMLYTERKQPGKRFISSIFPDNRALDRAIYAQHFQAGDPVAAGAMPWILLDRSGKVLRSGIEGVKPERWDQAMERRFPGIDAQEVTITPITDDAGEPLHDVAGGNLQMHTIWLAPNSPAPRD